MLGERLAGGRPEPGHHVEDAVRQPRLLEDVREEQRGERGVLGRLHHGGAARRENRREALAEDHQRMIEGRRVAHHADGSAQRVGEVGTLDRHHRVAPREREPGVVAEEVGDAAQLRPGLVDRPAVVRRLELEQLRQAGLESVGDLVDEPGARPDVHPPLLALEGAKRSTGRSMSAAVPCGTGDHFAGRRIVDVDLVHRGRHVLAVDEHAVARNLSLLCAHLAFSVRSR